MTPADIPSRTSLEQAVERVAGHVQHVRRRAEILRQFADQGGDAATADADGDELLAADLRTILSAIASARALADAAGPFGLKEDEATYGPGRHRPDDEFEVNLVAKMGAIRSLSAALTAFQS